MTKNATTNKRRERSSAAEGVTKVARTALDALKQSQQRRRSIAELRSMSNRDLRDIGLERHACFFAVYRSNSDTPFT